jgi:hypothetical protein
MLDFLSKEAISTILSAVSGLLAVVLGYAYKTKRDEIRHINASWENLIEENVNFRREVKTDLDLVKKERDVLSDKIRSLEMKLADVIEENIAFRRREIDLVVEVRSLREENDLLKKKIAAQDQEIEKLKLKN